MKLQRCALCLFSLALVAHAKMHPQRRQANSASSPPPPDTPSSPAPAPISTPPAPAPPPPVSPPPSPPSSPPPAPPPPITVPPDTSSSPPAPAPITVPSTPAPAPVTPITSAPGPVAGPSTSATPTDSSATPTSDVPSLSTSIVVVTISGSVVSSASVVNLASVASSADDQDGNNVKAWAIPVGIIGGLIGAGILGYLVWWAFKRRGHRDEAAADFDAAIKWPTVPDSDDHLPPESLRQTGRSGVGDDGYVGRPLSMVETSPQMSKSGHSRASSVLDMSTNAPYSDEQANFGQYLQQQYGNYYDYNDYGPTAPYAASTEALAASHAGLAPAQMAEQPLTPPLHYAATADEPLLPYAQNGHGVGGLERDGTVRSVQSINGQRALGVVNPDTR